MKLGQVMQAVRGGERNKQTQKCREEMVNSGARVMLGDNCPGKLMCKSWRWHKKHEQFQYNEGPHTNSIYISGTISPKFEYVT